MHVRTIVIGIAVFGFASEVRAQSSAEKMQAEALFRDARALMNAGKAADACPKLAESQRLDPQIGTALNLGICHASEGKTATGWAELREVAEKATAAGDSERAQYARQQADALEPTLARLQLSPAAPLPADVTIEIDGVSLRSAALASPLPVDPGERTINVTAPGKIPWTTKTRFDAGVTTTVDVPALENAPVVVQPKPPPEGSGERESWRPILGYGALGVGVVGLAVGSIFGLQAASKKSDADERCPGDVCTPEGHDLENEARTAAVVSTIGFAVGIVGAAAGVVLLVTAPSRAPSRTSWIASPLTGASALRFRW